MSYPVYRLTDPDRQVFVDLATAIAGRHDFEALLRAFDESAPFWHWQRDEYDVAVLTCSLCGEEDSCENRSCPNHELSFRARIAGVR